MAEGNSESPSHHWCFKIKKNQGLEMLGDLPKITQMIQYQCQNLSLPISKSIFSFNPLLEKSLLPAFLFPPSNTEKCSEATHNFLSFIPQKHLTPDCLSPSCMSPTLFQFSFLVTASLFLNRSRFSPQGRFGVSNCPLHLPCGVTRPSTEVILKCTSHHCIPSRSTVSQLHYLI